MKKVVMISGSPKINEPAVSKKYLEMIDQNLDAESFEKYNIDVRQSFLKKETASDYDAMLGADVLIFAFPLYFFCTPGILMDFLQGYYALIQKNGQPPRNVKVYTVVNCGFPEADINTEGARVIESFSRHIGADYRFGVLIGGGGMVYYALEAPFMKKCAAMLRAAFARIAADITDDAGKKPDSVQIVSNFPRRLYFRMGNLGWMKLIKKNGMKKADLYNKPYQPE